MAVGSIYIYGTNDISDGIGELTPDSNSEVNKSRLDNMVTAGDAFVLEVDILDDNYSLSEEGESKNTPVGLTKISKSRKTFNIQTQKYQYPDNLTVIRTLEGIARYNNHYIGVNDYIGITDIVSVNTKVLKVILTSISRQTSDAGFRQLNMEFQAVKVWQQ